MGNPHAKQTVVIVSHDDARRLEAFVLRVGYVAALGLLGVGAYTLDTALDEGRLMRTTRDRLFARLATLPIGSAAPPPADGRPGGDAKPAVIIP